jgi:N-formylglutamate amidohydrolase
MTFNNLLSESKICAEAGVRVRRTFMQTPSTFSVHNVDQLSFPVLLSVPHAGRDYPDDLLANLRVGPSELLRLEDRYADRLVRTAMASGFPTIIAHRARAWVDLNRAETDIDIEMIVRSDRQLAAIPGAKARGGLGLIPRRLQSCGELWTRPWSGAAIEQRLNDCHRPFHQTVGTILSAIRDRFGIAILLDVHSMPPIRQTLADQAPPQFVLGDRFGRSAASVHADLVMAHVRGQGFEAALNAPYSGDYMLQAHGSPARNIHALQLEVDRSLYLDTGLREPSANVGAIAALVGDIASLLASHAAGEAFAEAAE